MPSYELEANYTKENYSLLMNGVSLTETESYLERIFTIFEIITECYIWRKEIEEVVPERRNRQTVEGNRTIVHGTEGLQMEQKRADKCSIYLVDSGCKWRQLPHDFPPYSTVHSFYIRARKREDCGRKY